MNSSYWKMRNQAHLCLMVVCVYFCFQQSEVNCLDSHNFYLLGKNITLTCNSTNDVIYWQKSSRNNITNSDRISVSTIDTNTVTDPSTNNDTKIYTSILIIQNSSKSDAGNYTCFDFLNKQITVHNVTPIVLPKVVATSPKIIRTKDKHVTLFCKIELYPLSLFKNSIFWAKEYMEYDKSDDANDNNLPIKNTTITILDETHINVTLELNELTKTHNGTYACSIVASPHVIDENIEVRELVSLLILDVPQVMVDYIKAVGANKIFMNWTVNDGNDPVEQYLLQYMKNGTQTFTYYMDRIDGSNTSYVLDKFEPDSSYQFKLQAKNKQGTGPAYTYPHWITTLSTDPSFTPIIETKGNTHSTITVGWVPPPPNLLEFIHYYELVVSHAGENASLIKEEAIHPQNSRNLPYMFDNLSTATEYNFKVRACSELTRQCGNWSKVVNGTTMDGISSEPLNIQTKCVHFNISRRSTVSIQWDPPKHPNGKLVSYQIILTGFAAYKSENGVMKNETYGPKIINVDEKSNKANYDSVPANTNFTVKVAGVTRSKKPGQASVATCQMPATVPDNIGRLMWGKLKIENGIWVFKLFLPPISERNGPICCYKIYLIRMNPQNEVLPLPENLDISNYNDVHAHNNTKGGAYLAEVLSSEDYKNEIFLGDGKNVYDIHQKFCPECHISERTIKSNIEYETTTTTTSIIKVEEIEESAEKVRRETKVAEPEVFRNTIIDGMLDSASNYTGFVEIIVKMGENDGNVVSTYSEYFQVMSAGAPLSENGSDNELSIILNIVIQIVCGLILILLLLLMLLCFLHKHYSKNLANGEETISLRDSLRALCRGRNNNNQHRYLIGSTTSKPPVIPPINKDELPQSYQNKHKDSDYGFQHEFELLPDKFTDRTSKNSEAKENIHKNRYPDIKAYDQTRVKLSMTNGLLGSDYINANFVIGYKERKKFICAQGPMDSTINDFWQMIWEQHLELIVMLTNLEEYNKTKCAKYWPEKIADSTQYGDYNVIYQSENYFSEYLVRNLKVTKRNVNQNGEDVEDTRYISQYHYLAWKDFMAPEHPQGITKFIRRINSEYSLQRGPILVHCSAGVGRTGTFVALDTLTQQLEEEGQVSIFNTICDMRYQRNFLVQSLKQYIFLYRALTDIAYFGDTELEQKSLNTSVETLKQRINENEMCKLELQFEKVKNFQEDIKKTFAVGCSEEHRSKNRVENCIPFDRNRVILAPIPGRENVTYINASFIDGYDEANSFIITQDPLENTIFDFWRMISEQRIKTIVMFSEIGEGQNKCPRYWADDEMLYENILVKYIQSESGPYYTRREFTVTNCKINDSIQVTQFQYHGWPTVEGEVPEVTRGMIEIVNQAQQHSSQQDVAAIAVHCNLGSDKSSIFVAMCMLVMQLKTEKRIDICTVVRKLRAQRNLMVDTYAQYEFLHRAIVNYADLFKTTLGISPDC